MKGPLQLADAAFCERESSRSVWFIGREDLQSCLTTSTVYWPQSCLRTCARPFLCSSAPSSRCQPRSRGARPDASARSGATARTHARTPTHARAPAHARTRLDVVLLFGGVKEAGKSHSTITHEGRKERPLRAVALASARGGGGGRQQSRALSPRDGHGAPPGAAGQFPHVTPRRLRPARNAHRYGPVCRGWRRTHAPTAHGAHGTETAALLGNVPQAMDPNAWCISRCTRSPACSPPSSASSWWATTTANNSTILRYAARPWAKGHRAATYARLTHTHVTVRPGPCSLRRHTAAGCDVEIGPASLHCDAVHRLHGAGALVGGDAAHVGRYAATLSCAAPGRQGQGRRAAAISQRQRGSDVSVSRALALRVSARPACQLFPVGAGAGHGSNDLARGAVCAGVLARPAHDSRVRPNAVGVTTS